MKVSHKCLIDDILTEYLIWVIIFSLKNYVVAVKDFSM